VLGKTIKRLFRFRKNSIFFSEPGFFLYKKTMHFFVI